MPYKIEKVKGGFYVSDLAGKHFSKKPITKQRAIAQRKAIALNESKKKSVPINFYFAH